MRIVDAAWSGAPPRGSWAVTDDKLPSVAVIIVVIVAIIIYIAVVVAAS
jgi:hypothetical protein